MPFPRRAFYLVRHGQTDANLNSMMCGGDWDIPINETGRGQAQAIAPTVATLADPKPTRIFASPMLRARLTAEALNAQAGLDIEVVEGLREWRVGTWEARPWNEVPNPFNTTEDPPGGETRLEFERRVAAAVHEVLARPGVPLLVTHGAVAHALFTLMGVDRAHVKNCEIYLVDVDSETHPHTWRLRALAPTEPSG